MCDGFIYKFLQACNVYFNCLMSNIVTSVHDLADVCYNY